MCRRSTWTYGCGCAKTVISFYCAPGTSVEDCRDMPKIINADSPNVCPRHEWINSQWNTIHSKVAATFGDRQVTRAEALELHLSTIEPISDEEAPELNAVSPNSMSEEIAARGGGINESELSDSFDFLDNICDECRSESNLNMAHRGRCVDHPHGPPSDSGEYYVEEESDDSLGVRQEGPLWPATPRPVRHGEVLGAFGLQTPITAEGARVIEDDGYTPDIEDRKTGLAQRLRQKKLLKLDKELTMLMDMDSPKDPEKLAADFLSEIEEDLSDEASPIKSSKRGRSGSDSPTHAIKKLRAE